MNRTAIACTTIATLGLISAALVTAGPLNPPGGAVSSTYKTLNEVEPRIAISATSTPGDADSLYRITQPGSYYLTGNIFGAAGRHGIEIAANGVTLDLNGFELTGVGGSLDAVSTTIASLFNIVVKNGTIRNWSGDGVDLQTSLSFNTRIEEVQANFNTGFGIRAGNGFVITRCGARSNGLGGFTSAVGGLITDCDAASNSGAGMLMGQNVSVDNCRSSFNVGTADGIVCGGFGGAITNCTVSANAGNGIVVNGPGTVITNCSVNSSDLNGIVAGSGTTITGCTAYFSQQINIVVSDACTVADCTVSYGNLGGIRCATRSVIRNNTCISNANGSGTGFNIQVTGGDNRIIGNTCTTAARGIDVDAAGNILTGNVCSGNNTANWDVVAGNVCLVVSATPAGAILGFSGGVAPGSTDPSANFTY